MERLGSATAQLTSLARTARSMKIEDRVKLAKLLDGIAGRLEKIHEALASKANERI